MRRSLVLLALACSLSSAHHAGATSPSFTLGPGSPSLGAIPATAADVLNPGVPPVPGPMPPPAVGIPGAALGLVPGDVVNGLSFGILPPGPGPGLRVLFSVDPMAAGVPFAPPPPNLSCEAAGAEGAADIYDSQPFGPPLPFPNVLFLDGNGIASAPCGGVPFTGLGLAEPAADNLINLEMCPAGFVFSGAVLTAPVYFTLAAGSPTLVAVGATTADILVASTPGFAPPGVFLPAAVLGLVGGPPGCAPPACDAIDALDVTPAGGGFALLTLAPGSPSLAGCGYSPSDLLFCPAAPCGALSIPGAGLGLLAADNIDALSVNFDGDGDYVADPCDTCPFVPNNVQMDTDGDGFDDACDNCPALVNPSQTDTDADGAGDDCDACPHVTGGLPSPLTVKKILLIYGGTGPGSGDDRPKAIKAEFTAGGAFDPDSVDSVHVRFSHAGAPATLFAASLLAGPPWTQISSAPSKWKYVDAAAALGVRVSMIKEDPATPGDYAMKVIGKNANILGPIAGGAVTTTIEIENGGVGQCFAGVNAACSSSSSKEKCL